jgi:catechol 2,3-dioxygenase-like lactoylglutathione lyase family enzyme
MLHHVSVGVRDVERAAKFYDAVLGALGYRRVMEFLPYAVAYGETQPSFWVQLPQNQQAATAGNGVHISFIARSQGAVDEFHNAALAEGAKSDGEPGPRPDYSPDYYGAFVFDLDGNKLEATLLPKRTAKQKVKKAAKKAVKKAAPKAAGKAAAKTVKKAAKKKAKKAKKR